MLPNKPRGVPRVDDRRTLNGIFWVLCLGIWVFAAPAAKNLVSAIHVRAWQCSCDKRSHQARDDDSDTWHRPGDARDGAYEAGNRERQRHPQAKHAEVHNSFQIGCPCAVGRRHYSVGAVTTCSSISA
jgi:hypothetical protein